MVVSVDYTDRASAPSGFVLGSPMGNSGRRLAGGRRSKAFILFLRIHLHLAISLDKGNRTVLKAAILSFFQSISDNGQGIASSPAVFNL